MPTYLQWPDEFDALSPMVTFGNEFTTLLESQVSAGTTVTAEEHWSSFAFLRGHRMVEFMRRGKLGFQRQECWEVRLGDRDKVVQLGSVLEIRDYACVVTTGIENIRTITEMWLDGAKVELSLMLFLCGIR